MAGAVHTLVDGIYFGEGPRWHKGRLWFSDFYSHSIRSVSLEGEMRVELQLDDQPSGLGWMPDGSLLFVRMERLQVWRRWPDGRLAMHADLAGFARHLANDMVVDSEGRAYVGNFGFDLAAEMSARGPEGLMADHQTTTLAIVEPDGTVRAGSDGMSFPNGTVITPDGKTLVAAETFGGRLTAFDIGADGSLSNRRVWASTLPAVPDGICLDADGAIWVANPLAAQCLRIAEGGEVLDTVETAGLNCYACMLGGPQGKHLFMMVAPGLDAATAPLGKVLVCEVDSPGAGRP